MITKWNFKKPTAKFKHRLKKESENLIIEEKETICIFFFNFFFSNALQIKKF